MCALYKEKTICIINMEINDDKRTKKLTDFDKNRIIVYYIDKMSIKLISDKTGIHRNTISKWIDRYNEYGFNGLNRIEGTGKIKKSNKLFRVSTIQSRFKSN